MKKNYIAIDLGASSGRVLLGSLDDGIVTLTELSRFDNTPVMANGFFYLDILRIYHEVKKGLSNYANRFKEPLSGIGIDTWGVDFGLINSDGELISNPYHYRDDQTDAYPKKAYDLMSHEKLYGETGIAALQFNTIYQIMAMRDRKSANYDVSETALFIPDLLCYMLTGNKGTEYTIASTGQLLNVMKRDFSDSVFEKCNLGDNKFPPIQMPGTLRGYIKDDLANELGLNNVPVFAVAEHDTASAVVAVPAQDENFAYLSSGTWSLLGLENDRPINTITAMKMNFTNEGGAFNTYRFLKNIMGLWIFNECRRDWLSKGEEITFSQMTKLAEQAGKNNSFIDPNDDIFFKPGNMPLKIQEYCKKTQQEVPKTHGEILLCIVESLALAYRQCIDDLESVTGKTISTLHLVGGGIQNELLNQLSANAVGKPVIAGPIEATAIGNVMMQAYADKEIADLKEIRTIVWNSFPCRNYSPEKSDLWAKKYEKYLEVIKG